MIKVVGRRGDRRYLLLGLEQKNVDSLKEGKPLVVEGAGMGIPFDMFLVYGKTPEDIISDLKEAGLAVPAGPLPTKPPTAAADFLRTPNATEMACLLLYSVRYALGRSSYAVGEVCDLVRQYQHVLTPGQTQTLRCDIQEAITQAEEAAGTVGMLMDHGAWVKLLDDIVLGEKSST